MATTTTKKSVTVEEALNEFKKKGNQNGKKNTTKLLIPKPEIPTIRLRVVGLTPLLVHRFGAKAMKQMELAQSGAPKTRKREARDPEQDFWDSLYILDKNNRLCPHLKKPDRKKYHYGIPGAAFKRAAVSAARGIDGLPMAFVRQLIFVPQEYVTLEASEPEMHTEHVRLQNGSADIRYRGIFYEWECDVDVMYNAWATTAEQVVNLFILAGQTVGLFEKRPEKGHNYGTFTLK